MKSPIIFIFIILLFSSCSHKYYSPNAQNVPMLSEKDEFRVSTSVGAVDFATTCETQLAYAVTNSIGVMLNMGLNFVDQESRKNSTNYYGEAGVGYLKPIKKLWHFEVFGGMGFGKQSHYYNDVVFNAFRDEPIVIIPLGKAAVSTFKTFIQPSFGLKHKAVDIALSSRISQINLFDIEKNIDNTNYYYNELDWLEKNKNHIALEPALTIRVGWKAVKLQAQYSFSINTMNRYNYLANIQNFNIGLSFAFKNKSLLRKKK